MNSKLNFTLLDEYRKQVEEELTGIAKLHERLTQEKDKLQVLRSKYSEKLTQSVQSNEDVNDELVRIDEAIAMQERAVQRVKEAIAIYSTNTRATLTKDDVLGQFNGPFREQYIEKIVQPLLEKLSDLKTEFTALCALLKEAENEWDAMGSELMTVFNQVFRTYRPVLPTNKSEVEKTFLTNHTLAVLNRGLTPPGVDKESVEKSKHSIRMQIEHKQKGADHK